MKRIKLCSKCNGVLTEFKDGTRDCDCSIYENGDIPGLDKTTE